MEYYESHLNSWEQKFYSGMTDAFQHRRTAVKAERITSESSFMKCICAVQYDHPELFYVNFRDVEYIPRDDGWELLPKYWYDPQQTAQKRRQLSEIVGKICAEVKKRGLRSIYQKCGYIHAYLVRSCTYDYQAIENSAARRTAYTIEGPLLEKTGVCQGIAFAYRMLCRECGVDMIAVKGVSLHPGTTNYEGHAWNLVRAGECAAQIDVTWDMCLTVKDWPIRYDYFFLPDIEMMRDHQYVGYPICRKLQMSYFERSGQQFSELKEMESYLQKTLASASKARQDVCFLHFKLINRKESEEKIKNCIVDTIGKYLQKSWCYSIYSNTAQSVFAWKIQIGQTDGI